MKRRILPLLFVTLVTAAAAQDSNSLAPDQNPNYMISQQKYMNQKDSLLSWENTTVQQTYKAYDWREARGERRAERRAYRRQTNSWLAPSLSYGYPSHYGWNNYGYSPYIRYNSWSRWNRWGITRPFLGLQLGNFWLGF